MTERLTLSGSAHPSLSSLFEVRKVHMCSLDATVTERSAGGSITLACGSGTSCSWQMPRSLPCTMMQAVCQGLRRRASCSCKTARSLPCAVMMSCSFWMACTCSLMDTFISFRLRCSMRFSLDCAEPAPARRLAAAAKAPTRLARPAAHGQEAADQACPPYKQVVLLLLCTRHAAPGFHSEVRCMSCGGFDQTSCSPACSMRYATSRKPKAILKDRLLHTVMQSPLSQKSASPGICFTRRC